MHLEIIHLISQLSEHLTPPPQRIQSFVESGWCVDYGELKSPTIYQKLSAQSYWCH